MIVPVALLLHALAATASAKTLDAVPRGPFLITIDGKLDEPAWGMAPPGDGFIERSPSPGARPPVDTDVRVLFDASAIYVGVTMWLEPGERPRALELARDSFDIWSDDAISLKFDVRRDRRTTVGFVMNAAGAQLDYVALDNGKDLRREFDAVWQSAAWIGPDTWTAEFRLPVAALGLAPAAGDRVLGFQVSRDHNRRVATYDWTWMPPEFGAMAALYYGELRGLTGIGGGRPIAAIPFVLARAGGAPGDRARGALKAGGDLKMRIGADAWAELTIFTDFAQVDLDDPVVNLDRFPLFLPEKRPFFLSGLEVFDFGDAGAAQLFFSRRIGLDAAGREVPIIAGLKTYGRVGPVGFGLLDVLTQATDTIPGANWTVARLRRDAGDSAYVGALITMKESIGAGAAFERGATPVDAHYSVGVDGSARFLDERLELAAWSSATASGEIEDPGGLAAGASAVWRTDRFRPSWSVLYVSDDFRPAVGFVRRSDWLVNDLRVAWVERPPRLGLETVTLVTGASLGADSRAERVLRFEQYLGVTWAWRAGWVVESFGSYIEETVDDAFELVPGVIVPARTYRGGDVSVRLASPERRSPSVDLYYEAGAFFGGFIHALHANALARFGKHLSLAVGASVTSIDLPAYDAFATFTMSARLTASPSRNLSADAILLLNNVDQAATALLRLRWRFLPGSDAFLVYRHDAGVTWMRALDGVPVLDVSPGSWSVTLKASWRFDVVL